MLAPINYLLDNKSPMDSFVGGMGQIQGLRANDLANDNAQHVNTQYGLQNEAMAAKQQRQAQFEQEVDALDFTNMQDLRAFAGRYDDIPAIKGVQEAYKQLDDTKKQAMLGTVSRAYAATSKGRPEVAIADLKAQAEAYRNTNDESMAKQAEDMASFLEQSPEAGLRMLGIGLGAILPKDASDSYANVSKAFIGEDDAPVNRAKVAAETGKVNTEAVVLASDGLSAAAMVGDPELFKQKVDMFARAGAIPVEHADYLDALMKLPQEQAILALENYAKGNPEIAKAIMVSDASIYATDAGERNNIRTNTTSENNNIRTNATSENNNIRTTTVAENNNIRSNETSRYNTQVQAEMKKYGIDVAAANAQQQLEFKRNEAEFKEAGGKMYFVRKSTGEIFPALDANGNHLSGKTDATTVKTQREEAQRLDRVDAILPEIKKLLPSATGSKVGSWVDSAAGSIGYTTDGAAATAQLQTLAGQLVALMPKMSGPQSDKDVEMYKQMAGNLGDPTKTVKQRQAALQTIEMLNNKYRATNKATSSGASTGGNTNGYGDLFN